MDEVQNVERTTSAEFSPIRYFFRYWIPVVVWMALIFSASGDTQSVQRSDGLLARLLGWMQLHPTQAQIEMLRWVIRKGAHLAEYAILALLCFRALDVRQRVRRWSSAAAWWTLAICVAYAATDEFHQTFVKDRSGSILDVAIDTAGASLALICVWFYKKRRVRLS
jgi:VanZ family protein